MKYTLNAGRQSLASISTEVKIRCQYEPESGDFFSETAAWGFVYDSPSANIGLDRDPETAQDWANLLNLAEACQEVEKEETALAEEWETRLEEKIRKRTWEIISQVERDFPQVRALGDLDPDVFEVDPKTSGCFAFEWGRRCRHYEDVGKHLPEFEKFQRISDRVLQHFGLPEGREVHLYREGVGTRHPRVVAIFGRENRHHDFPQELLV